MSRLIAALAATCVALGVLAEPVRLAWDPVDDARVTSYELGWGPASRAYGQYHSVPAEQQTATIDLTEPSYIAVRAVATEDLKSDWSEELLWQQLSARTPGAQIGFWAQREQVIMADPVFGAVGTCINNSGTTASSMTSTLAGVSAGGLVLAFIQRDEMDTITGVTMAGNAMSRIASVDSGGSNFYFEVWSILAPANVTSANIVASFSEAAQWGSMVSARWSGVSSATPLQSATTGGLSSSSTNRYGGSITTTARALIVGAGTDWNNYNAHTAGNSYTLHFANNQGKSNCSQSVQWLYSKVADAGSYGGNATGTRFGTAASDQILAVTLAFEIAGGGAAASLPPRSSIFAYRGILGR